MDIVAAGILSYYQDLTALDENKSVYLVKHRETGEIFVKKIKEVYTYGVYQKLGRLNLDGVPKLYECVEADGKLYLIEEYISGKTLEKIYQEKGRFTEEEVIRIGLQLCKILKFLHGCVPPIIHRDIKPSNLMLTSDGVLKLIDFNAAKEYHDTAVCDTVFLGTQDYAAPEQYGFGQSDARTDIYGFGVTMNYLLCGQFPRERLCNGRLREIVLCCTQVDSQKRYQTVRELERALRSFIDQKVRGAKRTDRTLSLKERRGLYSYHPYFPPGFRSGSIWKMMVAFLGYWLLFECSLEVNLESNGQAMTGALLWVNRICILIGLLLSLLLFCDYGNMRRFLPGLNKKWYIRIPLLAVYSFLILIVCVVFASLIETLF